jgi:hypothetical protein
LEDPNELTTFISSIALKIKTIYMATKNQLEIKKFITPEIKKKMTTWEKEFITSLFKREKDWTDKQIEVFDNIKNKYKLQERIVIERIIYLPTGYAQGAKINQDITTREYRKKRYFKNNRNEK